MGERDANGEINKIINRFIDRCDKCDGRRLKKTHQFNDIIDQNKQTKLRPFTYANGQHLKLSSCLVFWIDDWVCIIFLRKKKLFWIMIDEDGDS